MTVRGLAHAIDFGTSTSEILICQPDGATIAVPDRRLYGASLVPTSIFVRRDGSVLVGTNGRLPTGVSSSENSAARCPPSSERFL
jgi:uncharacterized protein (DUF302 family)